MARPKTKSELLSLSQSNYEKLIQWIEKYDLTEQQMDFSGSTMNRNIRDVLAHLHHWHLMFLEWYKIGMQGQKPAMPAEGYTWKTVPQLNRWIWEQYRDVDLVVVKKMLQESYTEVQKIIERHTDEELFTKKRYKWTGSTSLGAYLVSATSSHYDWAWKLIKKNQ
ncbi:MAG: ClbS/DfsB family four-helix bundle protein [Saprospiraceae bacterium]